MGRRTALWERIDRLIEEANKAGAFDHLTDEWLAAVRGRPVTQIYVITGTTYEVYGIAGVLEGVPGQDIGALYAQFKTETKMPQGEQLAWAKTLQKEWGTKTGAFAPELFVEWLVRSHKFWRVNSTIIHLDDFEDE